MGYENLDQVIARIRRRNQVLLNLDVAGFKAWLIKDGVNADRVNAMTDEVAVCAMHKTRAELVSLERSVRLDSIEWLRARNYGLQSGAPLPPKGELPI